MQKKVSRTSRVATLRRRRSLFLDEEQEAVPELPPDGERRPTRRAAVRATQALNSIIQMEAKTLVTMSDDDDDDRDDDDEYEDMESLPIPNTALFSPSYTPSVPMSSPARSLSPSSSSHTSLTPADVLAGLRSTAASPSPSLLVNMLPCGISPLNTSFTDLQYPQETLQTLEGAQQPANVPPPSPPAPRFPSFATPDHFPSYDPTGAGSINPWFVQSADGQYCPTVVNDFDLVLAELHQRPPLYSYEC